MKSLIEHRKESQRGERSVFSTDHFYWVSIVPEEALQRTHEPFSDGFWVWVFSMEMARRTQKPGDLSIDRVPENVFSVDVALSTTDLGINGVRKMPKEVHDDSAKQAIGWLRHEPEHEPQRQIVFHNGHGRPLPF